MRLFHNVRFNFKYKREIALNENDGGSRNHSLLNQGSRYAITKTTIKNSCKKIKSMEWSDE